ncbi:hypothetical protein D9613_004956 [Agrocybe pediades]|uniref:tRNA (guanine(9)-N1)-methyltransferase n=1 Tax=Agrocybe pediades TaxID=84607 RepID=A0A8H4VQX0_9AGAR|nr:hypothetical protein D9613_004956 [Agrocybe pediades]KAF9567409.1 hypothetical protein CPC08DRAFT_740285 [Agrocybe pediades]
MADSSSDARVQLEAAVPPSTPGEAGQSAPPDQKPLSKNALKKAAKAERFAALKLERRAREKEAKKEKKRQLAEKRAAGELDEEEEERKRRAKRPKLHFGGNVVVDLGFDDMMNEKEIKSLCSQLAYTHSANRQASFPFSLTFTSLNGRTYQRLESLGDASYKRWANTTWWSEGYDRLWKGQDNTSGPDEPVVSQNDAPSPNASIKEDVMTPSSAPAPLIPQDKIVYLTADTEDELLELKPDEVYIIGGICDHNRYKNLCLNKAKESGVRTARLPIGRYLASLPTRKVLTVNQVFEILVKWVETKDWEEALYSVIPKRKFQQGGKGNHDTIIDATAVEGDAEDEEGKEEDEENEALESSTT